ncbi:DUF2125 domain-containing protein [Thalassobaculum sp.]|uniref:DUF2125 domain-containing protein n=1 Tax=Thalassobaculum sp. TaxID=2022740 RepID=UPI0032ECA049
MSSPDTTRPGPGRPQPADRKPLRRRLGLVAGGAVLLLVAGWIIAWQLVALRVEASLGSWIDQRRALGDRIEHGPMALGGFPLTVAVTLRQVHWTREDGPTLLAAAASEVVASSPLWNPFRVTVVPTGGGRASAAGSWGSVTADAGLVVAVVSLGQHGPRQVELTLRNLDLIGPGGAVLATVEAVDAHIDPTPEPESGAVAAVPTTLEVSGSAAGVRPTGVERLPFEGPATLSWQAALRGAVDPTAGLPGLAMWRDAGGVIDVNHLSVSWSPVDLVGDGTVALDAAMRPEGAGVAQVQGVAEALDRLVALGRLKPGDAALLKIAAIAASEPSEDGSRQRLKAPVSAQDGTLRIGQFPVARVRSIAD